MDEETLEQLQDCIQEAIGEAKRLECKAMDEFVKWLQALPQYVTYYDVVTLAKEDSAMDLLHKTIQYAPAVNAYLESRKAVFESC